MTAKRLLLPGLMVTVFAAGYLLGSTGGGDFVPRAEPRRLPLGLSNQHRCSS